MPVRKWLAARQAVLFFVLFFFVVIVIVVVIVGEIAVSGGHFFFFVVIIVIFIVGDEIEVDRMRLRDLEFGFALGATENFAFLDLVFIDIDLGGTFGTANHRCILRKSAERGGRESRGDHLGAYYIPRDMKSTVTRAGQVRKTRQGQNGKEEMTSSREYPERPIVGIGGVIILEGKAVLIRRGSEPLKGQWSIPGGSLELGETLERGVERELLEETGLKVKVVEFIEVFDRVYGEDKEKPRFHYVIVDYLCERIGGELKAGGDAIDVALAGEEELERFGLTETATRILKKAFAMEGARRVH